MKRTVALCSIVALAGCGQPEPVVLTPPPALLTCADEPPVPELPSPEYQKERDVLTLAYVLALRSAWGDCRSKVDGVRAWVDEVSE